MLLDLTDNRYTERLDNNGGLGSRQMLPFVIPRSLSVWNTREGQLDKYSLSILNHNIRDNHMYRCDSCGDYLSVVNSPYDYKDKDIKGTCEAMFCIRCNDHLIRGFSLANELNRTFIEARVSTEFTRLILESENLWFH